MRKLIFVFFVFAAVIANAQSLQFRIGDKAPEFTATTHTGSSFSLSKTGKPVVLVFYRGYWCPFCNRELSALNDSLFLLQQKGASVIAVSPEKYESVDKTIEKTKASFPIISDTANTILKLYGVNFKVDDNTVERYKKFGVDFTAVNANNENTLPVPAVFIIDAEGNFKYIWFDKDYRKRPSIKALLDNL